LSPTAAWGIGSVAEQGGNGL